MIGNWLSSPDMLLFESRICDVFLQSINFSGYVQINGGFHQRTIMSGRHHGIHQLEGTQGGCAYDPRSTGIRKSSAAFKMESISNNEVIILRNLKGLGIMNHLQKQQGSAVGRD